MSSQTAPPAPTPPAAAADAPPVRAASWDIESVDVDAYLARIGHPRVAPSAATLRSLSEAHASTIPFENVDVLLGNHRGIGLAAITDKLVYRLRGGYCFEHALLFAAVAERLGFGVRRLIARVQPHRTGAQTHMTLRVTADGIDHLVDVGFGAGMLRPMPLRDGVEVDQAGWPHRLTRSGDVWTLEMRTREGGWEPRHEFDERPARPIDYEVAHHYVSTHPNSPFTGQLVVMRIAEGMSRRLVGSELTVEYPDGRHERSSVPLERLDTTLRELGVVLDRGELAELRSRLSAWG